MTRDHIQLELPATADFLPLLRLASANLAADCGFVYDRVEDVRIAVAEAFRVLLGQPGDTGRFSVDFTVDDGALGIEVHLIDTHARPVVAALSEQIFSTTTDAYRIDGDRTEGPVVSMQFYREPDQEG